MVQQGNSELSAPSGVVTFVFTDIESSMELQSEIPLEYAAALRIHNDVLMRHIRNFEGYAFHAPGDAFCVAFSEPRAAVEWALAVQTDLHALPWSDALLAHPAAATTLNGLQRGLRVRIGIHLGVTESTTNPATGKPDYAGASVSIASRLCMAAHGGQIVMSEAVKLLVFGQGSHSQKISDPHAELTYLGPQGLKGTRDPMQVWQIEPATLAGRSFPPLRSTESVKSNIPSPSRNFFGREGELLEVSQHLCSVDRPVVTLVGAAGMGKTALALEYGRRHVNEFPAGLWLIDASNARTRPQFLEDLARNLSVPLVDADPLSQICRAIQSRVASNGRLLLIIDNVEQVINDAAPCLEKLRQASPLCAIIVTSRERLSVPSERIVEVGPLAPSLAVELFLDRARIALPTFAASDSDLGDIEGLCECLDHMPLALELAAARAYILTVRQIRDGLVSRFELLRGSPHAYPPRQVTLQCAIEWSWELLTEEERSVFRQCAVFEGGFNMEAAVSVISMEGLVGSKTHLDLLQALVDKSLLRAHATGISTPGRRFGMFASIQDFARQRLEVSAKSTSAYERYAEYFVRKSVEWASDLETAAAKSALDSIQLESGNLRHLLTLGTGVSVTGACEVVLALSSMHAIRGPNEGRVELLKRAEASLTAELSGYDLGSAHQTSERLHLVRLQVLILASLCRAEAECGNPGVCESLASSALELAKALVKEDDSEQNRRALIRAQLTSFSVALNSRPDRAPSALDLMIVTMGQNPEKCSVALVDLCRGELMRRQGQFVTAMTCLQNAEKAFRELGQLQRQCATLLNLGLVYLNTGDYTRSSSHLNAAEAIAEDLGDSRVLSNIRNQRGVILAKTGKHEESLACFKASADLARKIGDRKSLALSLDNQALVHEKKGDLEKALACRRERDHVLADTPDPDGQARNWLNEGNALLRSGVYRKALEKFQAAASYYRQRGAKHDLSESLILCGCAQLQLATENKADAVSLLQSAKKDIEECLKAMGEMEAVDFDSFRAARLLMTTIDQRIQEMKG